MFSVISMYISIYIREKTYKKKLKLQMIEKLIFLDCLTNKKKKEIPIIIILFIYLYNLTLT